MQAKNVLYAAVGAPVVAAKKVSDTFGGLKTKITEEAGDYTKAAEKAIETWAVEGEKVVARVTDNERVEELAARVDLDQAKEQVGKLRTQLEDMLDTWRSSFRPEKGGQKVEVTEADKPAAKTSTARKPAAKKPAAKTSTAKKPAAKTSTAKKPAAKTTASKSTTTSKTSSAKAS